jgi:hypothetical protein
LNHLPWEEGNDANAFNEGKGPNALAIVLTLIFQLFLLSFYASSYPPIAT